MTEKAEREKIDGKNNKSRKSYEISKNFGFLLLFNRFLFVLQRSWIEMAQLDDRDRQAREN